MTAKEGQKVIESSSQQMRLLVKGMEAAVPMVNELASNNDSIIEILAVIEGISEQEVYTDDDFGMNGNAIRGFLLSVVLDIRILTASLRQYTLWFFNERKR